MVGERWTLLIVRDLFFGVRRFTDLQTHLDIPRAVLSARLASLVERGLSSGAPTGPAATSSTSPPRGEELWPVVHTLMQWGDRHFAGGGRRRVFLARRLRRRAGRADAVRRAAPSLRRPTSKPGPARGRGRPAARGSR